VCTLPRKLLKDWQTSEYEDKPFVLRNMLLAKEKMMLQGMIGRLIEIGR
jgi:hypothetical protein